MKKNIFLNEMDGKVREVALMGIIEKISREYSGDEKDKKEEA